MAANYNLVELSTQHIRDRQQTDARLNQQRAATWTNFANQISQGVQAGIQRRQDLEARNMAIRDREYALATEATDKLVQAQTGTKYTDQQLQQTGQQFKQEFYDAVKEYENSDKGDEARQKFEMIKQKSLGSARTIGASIEKLGTSMEAFKNMAATGGISDAMNPAIRSFFNDLNDPNTPPEQFQIVTDEASGQLKYQGETTDGHPVDFFLDDLANGENDFAPVAKADMPAILDNLLKDVKSIKKQEEREDGRVVNATDWDAMGPAIISRFEAITKDPANFKTIAAGLGYGYEELQALNAGEPILGDDGTEITDIDMLKKEMQRELLQQVESVVPHEEEVLYDPNAQPTLANQAIIRDNVKQNREIFNQTVKAAGSGNLDYFKQQLAGDGQNVVQKDGKIVLTKGFGKKATVTDVFDPKNPTDLYRLTELMGGNRNFAQTADQQQQLESSVINF